MSYALGVVQSLSAIVYNFTAPGEAVLFLTPCIRNSTMSPRPGTARCWRA